MKTSLHDPARGPSGQFIDRRRVVGRVRTVLRGRPLPSAPVDTDLTSVDVRRAKARARHVWALVAATAQVKNKRAAYWGKGAQVRKQVIYTWRGAADTVAAGLSASEQAFLDGVRARLAALPPGFTDDLFNAPPFPAGVPEILGGD